MTFVLLVYCVFLQTLGNWYCLESLNFDQLRPDWLFNWSSGDSYRDRTHLVHTPRTFSRQCVLLSGQRLPKRPIFPLKLFNFIPQPLLTLSPLPTFLLQLRFNLHDPLLKCQLYLSILFRDVRQLEVKSILS